jgi:hypothetical protein
VTATAIILDRPMRCWAQMVTVYRMAEASGATVHLTAGCYGESTPKRPGMGSGCMPHDPKRGYDRCRHNLTELRQQGAIDVGPDIKCWIFTPGAACDTCRGQRRPDGHMWFPDEYPTPRRVPAAVPRPGELLSLIDGKWVMV